MTVAAALNIAVRIGIFENFPAEESITATVLASQCKAGISITTRAMRLLVVNGIFEETGVDEYRHNKLSLAFHPTALGGMVCVCVDTMMALVAIPDYVKTHKPEELYDIRKSPFAFATGHEGKTYYEVVDMDLKYRELWNLTLQNMEKDFPILGMFPFEELETKVQQDTKRPFIVDVGGGRGQALLAIQAHCGGSFGGSLILQDLPVVIDSLKPECIPGIKPMAYDIFTTQPIKDAHVYFMRRLLHDFYDEVVVEILKNIMSAMGPDSRLIICDMLIPDRVEVGGPMTAYWLDLSLLAIGGRERSLADFQNIFNEVGLELVKVYKLEGSHIAMLETRVRQK